MIRYLPLVLAAVAGALPAAGAGWVARGWAFERFERPAIEEKAADACTILTQTAARDAEDAERARQQQVTEDALSVYRKALLQSQLENTALEQRTAQEISDYENELAAAGRSCPLTERDIDWLRTK